MNRLTDLGAGIVLCACLILTSLFSENFTAACADHDCRGGGCPVCLLMQGARTLTRQLRHAAFPSGLFSGAVPVIVLLSWLAARRPVSASSVKLKVKMNE
jgi:hypothetical protein